MEWKENKKPKTENKKQKEEKKSRSLFLLQSQNSLRIIQQFRKLPLRKPPIHSSTFFLLSSQWHGLSQLAILEGIEHLEVATDLEAVEL